MRDDYLVPDAVVEIEPIYPKGGKIVWEWHVWDHLIQNRDRAKAELSATPPRIRSWSMSTATAAPRPRSGTT